MYLHLCICRSRLVLIIFWSENFVIDATYINLYEKPLIAQDQLTKNPSNGSAGALPRKYLHVDKNFRTHNFICKWIIHIKCLSERSQSEGRVGKFGRSHRLGFVNSGMGWYWGVWVPGVFKLGHLQQVEPLLFRNFSNFFTFILGGQFLLPQQRANIRSWGCNCRPLS